jgi:hypothetical protein
VWVFGVVQHIGERAQGTYAVGRWGIWKYRVCDLCDFSRPLCHVLPKRPRPGILRQYFSDSGRNRKCILLAHRHWKRREQQHHLTVMLRGILFSNFKVAQGNCVVFGDGIGKRRIS